jgi:signal transduction histidine kinase
MSTNRLHARVIALALYPLVLAIYFASDVWMWIGYQWRKREL